ncbi:MAG: hypothetical protein N2Z21_01360, partial [Candidatus Sumerlaeaceae bacterium]|nr:hypothetical protein [Candidatus Sumerlaeaceae bacterium]
VLLGGQRTLPVAVGSGSIWVRKHAQRVVRNVTMERFLPRRIEFHDLPVGLNDAAIGSGDPKLDRCPTVATSATLCCVSIGMKPIVIIVA